MSTDRETTRVVRSWLDEGVTRLPDRILDAVLDQVPSTPQRRSGWSAWRTYRMNTYAKLAGAAAAIALVAVLGNQLLPRNGGVGGPAPTIAPSPTPTLLAKGQFDVHGFSTTVDAAGAGSNVFGTMRTTGDSSFTVVLHCERTIGGSRWIAGDVTESNFELAPIGTRAGIILRPGTPVKALFFWQANDPAAATCQAFFDSMLASGEDFDAGLEPIQGTVELAP